MSHLHDSAASDQTKRSWLPIVMAIILPILLIIAGLAVVVLRGEERAAPLPATDLSAPMNVYITVKVENRNGEVLPEREVRFTHEDARSAASAETYAKKTDSAGMVTVTIPRHGDVTISVEGTESPKRLKNLEQNASETYELTIVVNEESSQLL